MAQANGLVLGAGGARGYAHLGVLQILQKNNIKMDVLVGCSAGAIAAALFACGQDLEQMGTLFAYPGFSKRLIDFSVSREGLVKGDKILDVLRLLTKDADFADLSMPLAIVATDIEKGELVVYREGSVAQAVRASISIPGFFRPYRYQGRLMVDGAVINRLPIGIAREMGAEKVLAVDVKKGGMTKVTTAMDVLLRSVEILEDEVFNHSCINSDLLIQPDVSSYSTYQFDKAGEIIAAGRLAAEKEISLIREIFG